MQIMLRCFSSTPVYAHGCQDAVSRTLTHGTNYLRDTHGTTPVYERQGCRT
jgi:hypothetical protein